MPRNTQPTREEPAPGTGLALSYLSDEVRADLLRVQQGAISPNQRLPQIKIMPAGAGLYEFKDNNDTVREFDAVVLNSHARNVLWEKPFGQSGADGEKLLPACSSEDGVIGKPREGFAHAALSGALALGTERIECKKCPYNRFGSKHLIPALMRPGDKGKGKAVVNQRVLYVMVEGRNTPFQLIIPPTSIPAWDEYLTSLLNQSIPVQGVVTKFRQERKQQGQMIWAVATFERVSLIDAEAFGRVMSRRSEFMEAMSPGGMVEELVEAENEGATSGAGFEDFPGGITETPGDDDMPF